MTEDRRLAGFRHIGEILREYLEQLSLLREGEAIRYGVPSGFADLDKVTAGGFERSDLIVLAARPSQGKSSLALAIASNTALKFRARVAIISLEMSRSQVAERLLSAEAGIETSRVRLGKLTDAQSRRLGYATGLLAEAGIDIDAPPSMTIGELRSRLVSLHLNAPLDLIVIDRLQLIDQDRVRIGTVREVVDIPRQLKRIAQELNVPILVVSEVEGNVESRRSTIPMISDLRDAESIEQFSDLIMFLHRDEYYNKNSEKQGIADVHIARNRNGPTGQLSLLFSSHTGKFLDLEPFRE